MTDDLVPRGRLLFPIIANMTGNCGVWMGICISFSTGGTIIAIISFSLDYPLTPLKGGSPC